MKKGIIFIVLGFILFFGMSTQKVSAKKDINYEVEFFFDEFKIYNEEWEHAKMKSSVDFYGDEDEYVGTIFRVFNHNIQSGYIIYLNQLGVVEAKFQGSDYASNIIGKVYFVFPGIFLSEDDFEEYKLSDEYVNRESSKGYSSVYAWFYNIYESEIDEITFDAIDTSLVPNLSSNYNHYVYYNAIKGDLDDTPDYSIYIYAGCAPTAASMLIAYYDNEYNNYFSSYEGPYPWQTFPMTYSSTSSNSAVESLMEDLALQMGCYSNACVGGVEDYEISMGINQYLDDIFGSQYTFVFSPINDVDEYGNPITSTLNYWSDYKTLISTGNPALLAVGPEEYDEGHIVFGIGYITTMSSITTGFYVHDGISGNGLGVTWISRDYVHHFGYITHYDAS